MFLGNEGEWKVIDKGKFFIVDIRGGQGWLNNSTVCHSKSQRVKNIMMAADLCVSWAVALAGTRACGGAPFGDPTVRGAAAKCEGGVTRDRDRGT